MERSRDRSIFFDAVMERSPDRFIFALWNGLLTVSFSSPSVVTGRSPDRSMFSIAGLPSQMETFSRVDVMVGDHDRTCGIQKLDFLISGKKPLSSAARSPSAMPLAWPLNAAFDASRPGLKDLGMKASTTASRERTDPVSSLPSTGNPIFGKQRCRTFMD